MILTKFCTPETRSFMLQGGFKIGTHAGYSKGEATGLLSDTEEGRGSHSIDGDVHGWNGVLGTNSFENITFTGGGSLFKINMSVNCNIFCCTSGPYDGATHDKLLNGFELYRPNSDLTAHILLDSHKFLRALSLMSTDLLTSKHKWVPAKVIYGARDISVKAIRSSGLTSYQLRNEQIKRAFTKPPAFKPENEFRFALFQSENSQPGDLFTSGMQSHIREAFQNAIISDGRDYPI